MNKMKNFNSLFLLIFLFINCSNKGDSIKNTIHVINSNDSLAYSSFKKMNLDNSYTNLLDPKGYKQKEYNYVKSKWSNFHKKFGDYIKSKNFQWNVKDSAIIIRNRIYFNKLGKVDYYIFKIVNSTVSYKKQQEFGKLLQEFCQKTQLNLERNHKYVQCGTTIFKTKNDSK